MMSRRAEEGGILGKHMTETHFLSLFAGNSIYIKRDDLYPVSFGGNKARKGELFFREIDRVGADCVVTYGSSSSNHCRVIANLAAQRELPCWVISPESDVAETANSRMVKLFGARYIHCEVSRVAEVIEETLAQLRQEGRSPYFIQGGGHGNVGTQAYVEAYREILHWEKENCVHFDYIFHASGTGTTQAGLICGQLMNRDTDRKIVGISIARSLPRGRMVVCDSVRDYLSSIHQEKLYEESRVIFDDSFICGGYGKVGKEIYDTMRRVLCKDGIPLCGTYTGKAFWGMEQYLLREKVEGKNVLFLHTGGTPLFFDDLKGF